MLYIDADSIIYRAGCSNETREYLVTDPNGFVAHSCAYKKDAKAWADAHGLPEENIVFSKTAGDLAHTLSNVKNILDGILQEFPDHDYQVFIGGHSNFRYDVYSEYKAHRNNDARPIHEGEIRKYLMRHYDAEEVDFEEVDDRVSYLGYHDPDGIIVSVDKDLLNTPGVHYNFVKKEVYEISEEQGNLNFARQLLTGDSSDNIPGLPGVGAKTAEKVLPRYRDDWEQIVYNEYKKRGFDYEYFRMNGKLLWMRREAGEDWEPSVAP